MKMISRQRTNSIPSIATRQEHMLDFGTGLVSAKVVARNEREARSPSIPHRVIRQPSSANKKGIGVTVSFIEAATRAEYDAFLAETLRMWPMLRPKVSASEQIGRTRHFLQRHTASPNADALRLVSGLPSTQSLSRNAMPTTRASAFPVGYSDGRCTPDLCADADRHQRRRRTLHPSALHR
jgi:hypothetical protein